MHQNAFGGRALPGPAGELKRSPRPTSRKRGPTSKGRGREGKGEGRGGKEGRGRGPSRLVANEAFFLKSASDQSTSLVVVCVTRSGEFDSLLSLYCNDKAVFTTTIRLRSTAIRPGYITTVGLPVCVAILQ